MANPGVTVHFYDKAGRTIVRTHTYATRKAAFAAMDRARARGQISGLAGTRTASDPPTTH